MGRVLWIAGTISFCLVSGIPLASQASNPNQSKTGAKTTRPDPKKPKKEEEKIPERNIDPNIKKAKEQDLELEIDLELEGVKNVKKAKKIEKEKQEFHRVQFEWELDPYYSNVALIFNLTDKPIPDAGDKGELEVYRDLFFSSYIPRYFLLEASVNPMPVAGVVTRKNAPEFYHSANVTDNLNLIHAVTAGFEEPYALSFFMGNVLSFSRPGQKQKEGNFGYMGWLFSYGNLHIVNNTLVEDHWYEGEWKIKGDRKFTDSILSWSFRIGAKWHDNPDITDVVYVGLRRSLLDFNASGWSLFQNSGFEYTMDIDYRSKFTPIRHSFTVDKKWPVKNTFGFVLALGVIWEARSKYTGELENVQKADNLQFVIRPNVEF